jgi:hypothetical protein
MRGENLTTLGQPVAGDNKYQYATRFQPAIGVAQERLLGAATVSRPQCPIVRGIQIEETKALHWALHFQRVSLDDVGNPMRGLLGSVGIKLDAVPNKLSTAGENFERHAIANAGVDSGGRIAWELEEPPDQKGFGQWQRVEAESTFALEAQGGLLSQKNVNGPQG